MSISKAKLAAELQLDESMISRLCTGQRLPSVASIYRMARFFEIDGDILIQAHVSGPTRFSQVFNELISKYNPKKKEEINDAE